MRKLLNIFKVPNIFLTLSIVFFIMWLLFRWHYHQTFPKEKIDALFEPVTSKYGIKIVYEIGDDFFSPLENPPIPAGPPRKSKIKPIRHRVLIKYPDILRESFEKYPVQVIRKYLKAIYFSGEIDDGDLLYSGTYDPFGRIIYLVDDGKKNSERAMRTFHHEFSSLLLSRHSFFINPWTDNNPKDFVYLTEKYKCWYTLEKEVDMSTAGSAEDYEKGFMRAYGQTDFENDFNEYSAVIFTYPEKFKMIMNQYPRVRGKFLVWLDFYQMIDPIFTEAYLLGEAENGTKQIPP
jgi:hypothetical protein